MMKPLSLLLFCVCFIWTSLSAAERPNVLFFAVDDLKPTIGAYGDPIAITPNMDKLASSGRIFSSAYCQFAVCSPTRASLLTGTRPDTIGVIALTDKVRKRYPNIITLPQHFAENGYAMMAMGKIFDGRTVKLEDRDKSYNGNYKWGSVKKRYFEPGKSELEDKMLAEGKNTWDVRVSLTDRGKVEDANTKDGETARTAISELKKLATNYKSSGQPFFLAVGFNKPHLPFNAPEQYWEPYDNVDFGYSDYRGSRAYPENTPSWIPPTEGTELAAYDDYPRGGIRSPEFAANLAHAYYACTSFIDAQIGLIMDELERQGLADNTIVILWGDHGWHLGDHDGFWAKHSNFEQATRVPLILRYPGMADAGKPVEQVVEFVDIYPTLVELAGLPAPKQPGGLGYEGDSMVSILRDPNAEWDNRAFSQRQTFRPKTMGYSVRNERYRFTAWYECSDYNDPSTQASTPILEELYDYQKDPKETVNQVNNPEYAQIATELRKELDHGKGWKK